jgi:DNA-binding NarL/FixJ family response regulator
MTAIRLLLVDDQLLFREGLSFLLSQQSEIEVVGEASDGQEAIDLAAQLQPDVILMDIRMPKLDGVAATQAIHQRSPWIKILVLTTFDLDDYIWKSLQAGALGYLLKNTPTQQMAYSIRAVHQGYGQIDRTIAARVFSQMQLPNSEVPATDHLLDWIKLFSDRELDVLKHLAQGKNNREIAQALNVTEGTVKNYVTRILWQLGLRDRTQAALWAQRQLSHLRFVQPTEL